MPLQKAIVPLGFQGLQTRVDSKTAPLGTFTAIENLILDKNHELIKRDGMALIGDGSTPTNIVGMYNMADEIGAITSTNLWSYSPNTDKFYNKGALTTPQITSTPIIANSFSQTFPDGAITETNIMGFTWVDSRGSLRFSVQDLSSGTFLQSDIAVTGVPLAKNAKVVAGGRFLFFTYTYLSSAQFHVLKYDTITNTYVDYTMVTGLVEPFFYDVVSMDVNSSLPPSFLCVYYTNSTYRAFYWNGNTNAIGTGSDGLPAPTNLAAGSVSSTDTSLSLSLAPSGSYYSVVRANDSPDLFFRSYTLFGTAIQAVDSQLNLGSIIDPLISLVSKIDLNNKLWVYISTRAGGTGNPYSSFQATVTNAGSATVTVVRLSSGFPFYQWLACISKPFSYQNNTYVIMYYSSPLQGTYFLIRDDGICSGRLYTELGNADFFNTLASINGVSSVSISPNDPSVFLTPLCKITKILAQSGSYTSTTSIFLEQMHINPFAPDTKALSKTTYIAGGYLKFYDGASTIIEQGFHLYPEINGTPVQGVGVIPAGTYSYKFVWEWQDNLGQLVRSQTSLPTTVVLPGVHNVTFTIKSLPVSSKTSRFGETRTEPVLAMYRTLNGGTTYYRVNQLPASWVFNSQTAINLTIVDNSLDTAISSNSVIYTTGGVFDNVPLPACNYMALAKNRIIVAGTDTEPNRIFYSKEKEEGVSVEFSAELSTIIDNFGGNITSLAAMDDKILIFKQTLVYFIAGQGPDKLGNGSFTLPQLVSADCGCISPQSIVLTGIGVMFKSLKGIYLIDRQLQISYIGQAVDVFNELTITSAVNLPSQNRVQFTTLEGITLVYDTFFSQWYTYTNQPSFAATSANSIWYIASTTNVLKSVPGQGFDGNNIPIISKIRTAWISLAGIEGFQRIYTLIFAGGDQSNIDRLNCNLYYDFKGYALQQLYIDPNLGTTVYGQDSPYGAEITYGGDLDGTAQYVVRPQQQKCSSIMVEFYDSFPNGINKTGFTFSELSMIVGIKQGYNMNLSPINRRFT